jgi:hypothetical protein
MLPLLILPAALGIASLVALAAAALLLVLPFFDGELQCGLPRDTSLTGADLEERTAAYTKAVHHFDSHGTRCEAWLYLPAAAAGDGSGGGGGGGKGAAAADAADCSAAALPAGSSSTADKASSKGLRAPPPPIILMAHGLGCQKDYRLPQFAAQFATNGYAVLLFDYRWGRALSGRLGLAVQRAALPSSAWNLHHVLGTTPGACILPPT